jgi:hypothetical protein
MKNPRYANREGGILLEQDGGVSLYVDSGELFASAKSGKFGPVADFVLSEIEIRSDANRAAMKIESEARAYLARTDWYVFRHYETGKAVPADVTDAREAARAAIV